MGTIQSLQPHSLFSIFVFLYLLRDFSPFTTTPVLVPLLLHNRKRSSVLVGLKVLGFLQSPTSTNTSHLATLAMTNPFSTLAESLRRTSTASLCLTGKPRPKYLTTKRPSRQPSME